MKYKPKILIFIDWYLPGYKAGGPVRSCANLVEHLQDHFEFLVVTRDTDYCQDTPYDSVKSNQWNTLEDGTWVYYFSNDRLNYKNLKQLVKSLSFDQVYVNGIYSYKFSILPLFLFRFKKIPVVIAGRGMFAKSAISIKKKKKKVFLKLAKSMGLYKNVVFHATNEQEEKDIMDQLGGKVSVKIAPNLPRAYKNLQWPDRKKQSGEVRLINVARIAPEKNLKYALELLREVELKITLDVYGPVYSEEYWAECKEVIASLPENVKVNYKGAIPGDQLQRTLKDYHFMIMPTRGENFGHIILESLLAGCPVIISDQTPWRDLESIKAGWDLSLDQPEKFVQVLKKCVELHQQQYNQWSKSAFDYGLTYVRDEKAVELNKGLFNQFNHRGTEKK